MQFNEAETQLLKTWIIKKLEDISDADADVLADYALALLSTNDDLDVLRASCVENLKDFLPDANAEKFVDELLQAIATKAYDPNAPKPRPAPVAPAPVLPTIPGLGNGALGSLNESRKRSYQEDVEMGQNGHINGNRPFKQMRGRGRGYDRGGRGAYERGGRGQGYGNPQYQQGAILAPAAALPAELPPWDPNNPMPAMLAMAQMFGNTPGLNPAAMEYDPANAGLAMPPMANGHLSPQPQDRGRGAFRGRGRGRGTNNFRGGGARSDLSQLGPNHNSSNTSIVAEQIPEDKLDEASVRGFFSEFGTIEEITVRPEQKLAVIKYADKASARAAYESPKVVFDNRFVKVYWQRSDNFSSNTGGPTKTFDGEDTEMQNNEPQIDQAELAKRQEGAQRKHEEAKKQREEAEKQKAALDAQLKAMDAERQKMAEMLAKRAAKKSTTNGAATNGANGTAAPVEENEQTKALKAQLAKLEAEAKSLGIDPNAPGANGAYAASPYRGRGRGRGGRGGFQPRGRGGFGAPSGGAVMRLDNRPKTIAVTFSNTASYDNNDEALRQFLLFNNMDTASVSKHPELEGAALVAFKQRYEAENFMVAARGEITHAGKVETSWYVPAQAPAGGEGMDVDASSGDREYEEMQDRGEEDLDRYA